MSHENKNLTYISTSVLCPHPDNPRKEIKDVDELAESITANGVMQNLTVVPHIEGKEGMYTVIIGHRRLTAAKQAGVETVPCVIVDLTPEEQIATMLLENMQRSDLTAYEEAQGFQMMLNMGETIKTVAEKTGFSETKVRNRAKWGELDQSVLKKVSENRQISLTDVDSLSKIEDIEQRNKVLASIGTSNFARDLASAIRRQKIAQYLPFVQEQLEKLKAKKLKTGEQYGSAYERIKTIYFSDWTEEKNIEADTDKKLFYVLSEYSGMLELYTKKERQPKAKKADWEIEMEKRAAKAWEIANESEEIAYKLRQDFVSGLRANSRNLNQMLSGALSALTVHAIWSIHVEKAELSNAVGVETKDKYGDDCVRAVIEGFSTADKAKAIPAIIYAAFADSESGTYNYERGSNKKNFPHYRRNAKMDALYEWLCSLGYQMSDDEKAMQDGTHAVFSMGKIVTDKPDEV